MSSTYTSVHDELSCNDYFGADCIDGYPIATDTCEGITVIFEIFENVILESVDIEYEPTKLNSNEFMYELQANGVQVEFIPDDAEEPIKQDEEIEATALANVLTIIDNLTQFGQTTIDNLFELKILPSLDDLFPSFTQPMIVELDSKDLLSTIIQKAINTYNILSHYEQMAIDNVNKLSMSIALAVVYKAIKHHDQIAINIIAKVSLSVTTLAAAQWHDTSETDMVAKFLIVAYNVWLTRNCMYLLSDATSAANILPPNHAKASFLYKTVTLVKLRIYAQAIGNHVNDIENQLFYSNADAIKYKNKLDPFMTKRLPITTYKSVVKDGIKKAFSPDLQFLPDIVAHGTANFFIANTHQCDTVSYFHNATSTKEFLNCSTVTYGKTLATASAKTFGEYIGDKYLAPIFVDYVLPIMHKIIPERWQFTLDMSKFISLGGGAFAQVAVKQALFEKV